MSELLIAEDDENIRRWLAVALRTSGHRIRAVADGQAALDALAEHRPDLVLLDIMMPRVSGWDVCTEIRRRDKRLPILILSAKHREEDKVLGLTLGADDYLAKPFGLSELRARITALLRRATLSETSLPSARTTIGSTSFDAGTQSLTGPDGVPAKLSRLETRILEFLIAHADTVVTRERLIDAIWGEDYDGTTRTLDTRIGTIRRKLGSDASRIETIYARGYCYHSRAAT